MQGADQLQYERGLSDPRLPRQQDGLADDEAPAQDPIDLADTGWDPLQLSHRLRQSGYGDLIHGIGRGNGGAPGSATRAAPEPLRGVMTALAANVSTGGDDHAPTLA